MKPDLPTIPFSAEKFVDVSGRENHWKMPVVFQLLGSRTWPVSGTILDASSMPEEGLQKAAKKHRKRFFHEGQITPKLEITVLVALFDQFLQFEYL